MSLVDLYTNVLYVLVLASAGIGQDLAYSDFLTLSICSRNIAMEVHYINSGPKKNTLCDLCKADLVYNKTSATNLLRHLRLRHPFEIAACEEKQLKPVSMP